LDDLAPIEALKRDYKGKVLKEAKLWGGFGGGRYPSTPTEFISFLLYLADGILLESLTPL